MLKTDDNILIQAPTASGKTLLFDFAIFKLFGLDEEPIPKLSVYIAPLKALCNERYCEWKNLFEQNRKNIKIQLLTGDTDFKFTKDYYWEDDQASKFQIINEGLLIITPEKFNLLLRKWWDYQQIIRTISLVLIDEIHYIGDDSRGAAFESMITRLIFLSQA